MQFLPSSHFSLILYFHIPPLPPVESLSCCSCCPHFTHYIGPSHPQLSHSLPRSFYFATHTRAVLLNYIIMRAERQKENKKKRERSFGLTGLGEKLVHGRCTHMHMNISTEAHNKCVRTNTMHEKNVARLYQFSRV